MEKHNLYISLRLLFEKGSDDDVDDKLKCLNYTWIVFGCREVRVKGQNPHKVENPGFKAHKLRFSL